MSSVPRHIRLPFGIFCLSVLVFLALPTLIVLPISVSSTDYLRFPPLGFSLRWYREYFNDPEWMAATYFSLKVALFTALASSAIGSMAAIALVRGRVPNAEVINTLILAPLIVPHIVTAIALYLQFVPLRMVGTTFGFVMAHTALAVPYVVLIVSAALSRVDYAVEMAALNLGASRLRVACEITVPLVAPAILASAVFAFLSSFDETIVSFFLSGVDNKTLTRKLFEDIDFNLSPMIAAVSTLIVAFTLGLMTLGQLIKRRAASDANGATRQIANFDRQGRMS